MLARVVAEAAKRFGDAPAFVSAQGQRTGFTELNNRRIATAALLRDDHGVRPGQVVALQMPSDVDYVVAYAAISTLGAITAGINPRLTTSEQRAVLERLQPDHVLHTIAPTSPSPDLGGKAGQSRPSTEVSEGGDASSGGNGAKGGEDREGGAGEERPVCIVCTSGTTGTPRGAVFCERQLRAIAAADWGADRWGGGPPILAATQFAHVGFMTKLPWYLMSGGTTFLLERWRAGDALRVLAEQRIPVVGGVAPQLALMLRDPSFDDFDWSHVQLIVMGGGPSSPALVREACERFDAPYSIRYSSTESGGVGTATTPGAPDDEALHSVGRARPGVELRVVSLDATGMASATTTADLPPGEVGELLLRSPTMFSHYWRDPDATDAVLVDGWVRTGDLARIDETGLVRLAGRAREMYVRGGYNVYPLEVEAVLGEHPAVAEVAIVGVDDDVMGERGCAVVVVRTTHEAPSIHELRTFATDRLAAWKLPEDLLVLDALPRTAMDKVDRRGLAEAVRRRLHGPETLRRQH